MNRIINYLPEIELEEANMLDNLLKEKSDEQLKQFSMIYRSKRKDPQMILILALVGFFAFAGIHRFVMNQIGMGILYILTGGLCLIGTIVDLVNYKSLTLEYNQKMAWEVNSYLFIK